jgi:hypothetical protein
MTTTRFVLAIAVLIFAVCIVVMNWWCVAINARNRKRGLDRHHSTVSLVSVLFAAVAYQLYPDPQKLWIVSIPLLDIANWRLLWLPVMFLRRPKAGDSAVPPDRRTP